MGPSEGLFLCPSRLFPTLKFKNTMPWVWNSLNKIIKAEMEILCAQRESANGLRKTDLENGWIPAGPVGNLEWGATYLDQIDSRWRRSYSIHSGGFSIETRPLIGRPVIRVENNHYF